VTFGKRLTVSEREGQSRIDAPTAGGVVSLQPSKYSTRVELALIKDVSMSLSLSKSHELIKFSLLFCDLVVGIFVAMFRLQKNNGQSDRLKLA
jgi:hypothetical protein